MRKILEVLRLRFVLGPTVRETSAALGVSTRAVSRTTERALGSELAYAAAAGPRFATHTRSRSRDRPVERSRTWTRTDHCDAHRHSADHERDRMFTAE